MSEWTSSVGDDDPWNEIRVNFRSSMDFTPKGKSMLDTYESDWGSGVKLGKIHRRPGCSAIPNALDIAVRDWADNFRAGASQTKPMAPDELGSVMLVNTAPEAEAVLLPATPATAPPSASFETARSALVKSPGVSPGASPYFRYESPTADRGRVSLAEDPRTAGSTLVAEGLAHAASPPRGRTLYSALRRGYGAVAGAVTGAAGGVSRALDAAMPIAEALNREVDRALEDERAAASAEKKARILASAEKRARAPANRLPEPAIRGLNLTAPSVGDSELARHVTSLPDGLNWGTLRTRLAGTGVNASSAWDLYKRLGKI